MRGRLIFLAYLVLAWGAEGRCEVITREPIKADGTDASVTQDAKAHEVAAGPSPVVVKLQDAPGAAIKERWERQKEEQALDYSHSAATAAWWQVWVNIAGAVLIFLTLVANAIMAKTAMDATILAREAEKDSDENLRLSREMMEWTAKTAHAMESSATATRRLVGAMRESAEAAKRSVDLAADTATRQLRPYVYITNEKISVSSFYVGSIGAGGSGQTFVTDNAPITFAIKNFGQTPAKQVRLRARAFIGDHWTEGGLVDLEPSATIYRADMPPGFERNIEGYSIIGLNDSHSKIRRAEWSIFFDGLLEYEDASGNNYQTEFRRVCTGGDLEKGWFFITPEGNNAT